MRQKWDNMRQYETIWDKMGQNEIKWDKMRQMRQNKFKWDKLRQNGKKLNKQLENCMSQHDPTWHIPGNYFDVPKPSRLSSLRLQYAMRGINYQISPLPSRNHSRVKPRPSNELSANFKAWQPEVHPRRRRFNFRLRSAPQSLTLEWTSPSQSRLHNLQKLVGFAWASCIW